MSPTEGHLSESALADWLSGALLAEEIARTEQHLDGCPTCVELVASTGRALAKISGARTRISPTAATPVGGELAIPLARGASVGRYLVLGQLGIGGMGIVYAAYDSELQRRVALKLLHPGAASGREILRGRVLREAQALARLSHPNVVAVYEAGAFGDEVFVALELIDGSTLRDWLDLKARSWREIVDAFAQAGRGLAAAHAAGIVHRDFKPDNALIGRDGRVRVTDFGLARVDAEGGVDRLPDDAPIARLTATGALLGSPAYMAPEQMDGAAADARADQFSFCVSLHEALFGERPFAGSSVGELRAAIASGSIRFGKTQAPAWVRRVLARGLSPNPAQRFPSMQALLEELGRDPAVRTRRALLLFAALGVAAVAFGASRVYLHQRAQLCSGAAAQVAAVWNPARRTALEQAFLATRLPFAADAVKSASQALDSYSSAWAAEQKSSCEATRLRGEQSEELLDLRADCLGRRLSEESALIDIFAKADAKAVENAARAVSTLTPLESCASAEALRAVPPPPAAQRDEVRSIRDSIARADAMEHAGQYQPGGELAVKNLGSARATNFPPLIAEAIASLGLLQRQLSDLKLAVVTLRDAANDAEATRQPLLAARVLTEEAAIVGDKFQKPDDGRVIIAHAQSLLDAYAGSDDLRARLLLVQGWTEQAAGNYPLALESEKRAMALAEKAHGPDDSVVAAAANGAGEVLREMSKPDEALVMHQRARDIWSRTLGPLHPKVASALNNIAGDLFTMQRKEEALATWQQALAIREQSLGPDHPDVASTLGNLALVNRTLNHLPEAEAEATRALAIKEHAFGPQAATLAYQLAMLSDLKQTQGDNPAALVYARREYAVRLASLGPNHPLTLNSALHLGVMLDLANQFAESVATLTPATDIALKVLGEESIVAAALLGAQGMARKHLGETAPAEALLLRALPVMIRHKGEPIGISQVNFALAELVWPRDHKSSLQYAQAARDALHGDPLAAPMVAKIDRWAGSHRAR